ncbi:MAG: TIGR01777 family oxidoreductase [Terriglobia bacterium]
MRTLITGSTGLIGTALERLLSHRGHEVIRLVRSGSASGKGVVHWDPRAGTIDAAALEGLDGVVHLAGENIAARRWTTTQKEQIRESRVRGTNLLSGSLARLARPPRVLVSASAIGYYGDCGDEMLREESPAGSGFLPEVCVAWEAATKVAEDRGIRVVHLRTGMVLDRAGGALAKMLPVFRMGAGGVIGNGRQYMSWIALDDVSGAIQHALTTDDLRGPVNTVAPTPVTNREFTKTLGRVLSRPTLFPLPAFAARLALGEMANELLLASQRVEPARLIASGYQFCFPDLEGALRHLLEKSPGG